MFNQLPPIEINCDAPPYSIVRACRMVGFRTPEDVRWARLSLFRKEHFHRPKLLNPSTWKSLLGMDESSEGHCSCGSALPILEKYTFTCQSGRELEYFLGQCPGCRTIFWESA
jgi:hypothetical protein